jgi:NAD(P)-dependent dehydrogenase (short-subunit alcohol dehydrogenase family)
MIKTTNPKDINFKSLFQLDGKVIIITGHKGLLGRAFYEACEQFGANVIGYDLPENDIMDEKNIIDFRDDVIGKYGKIDGLVNCHWSKPDGFFDKVEDYKQDTWDEVMECNLKGTFMMCQLVGNEMVENGGGNIVNIASTYSVVAPNHKIYDGIEQPLKSPASYAASKGGVMALSNYLSTYWADKNIRVNMITPHGIWNKHEKVFEDNFAELSPMKRLSCNYEVAGALIYLLSDASSYVTGHNLVVDGGWTAW